MSAASSSSSSSTGAAGSFVLTGVTADIRNEYTLGEQLGQPGQFGYALKAVKKGSKEVRAVKVISKCKFSRAADKKVHFDELRTEIDILRRMDHPNIIRLYDVFENDTEIYLVTELCSGGELFDRIKARGQYNEKDASATLRQLVSGLAYLHKNKIAHCDLKPDNFLFLAPAEDSLAKVIDFGMSKYVRRRQYFHSLRGTPYYIAPEVIQGHYSYHCDMWSMGVVMFVMLFGYPPFHADNDNDIFRLILKGFDPSVKKGYRAHFPQDIPCSESAKDLLAKLLTSDTAKRLTADEALAHPWMKGETASNTPMLKDVLVNLKHFNAECKFKRGVLNLMANCLNEDEISNLKALFNRIDENGDGRITVGELSKALEKAGTNITQNDVANLLKSADIDGDGTLSYNELVATSVQRKLSAKEERLWLAFCAVDLDRNGKVSAQEIEKVLGTDFASAKQMIAEVDKNSDGQIDFDEFITMWVHDDHGGAPAASAFDAALAAAVSK